MIWTRKRKLRWFLERRDEVTSERKIAANRINGRKGRGPRTAAGKFIASCNAFRHGLAACIHRDPQYASQLHELARAYCKGSVDPLLYEQALVIAECDLMLRRVSTQAIIAIERLQDGTAIALSKRDNSLRVAKARSAQADLAFEEIERVRAKYGITEPDLDIALPLELENQPPQPGWRPPPPKIRDEAEAITEALPDIKRLERYKRRAWSRRRRAFRELLEIERRNSTPPTEDAQSNPPRAAPTLEA
jgi:hypothetical protein